MTFKIDLYEDTAAFINRLEKFDKDVSKELKAEMRKASGDVVNESRAYLGLLGTPLRNWGRGWNERAGRDRSFNTTKAQSGVKAVAYRGRKAGATVAFGFIVTQKDPAGAIFEIAGTNIPGRTGAKRPGGETFTENLARKFGNGQRPRSLYPAYYKGIKSARAKIESAVRDAARKVGL